MAIGQVVHILREGIDRKFTNKHFWELPPKEREIVRDLRNLFAALRGSLWSDNWKKK